MIITTCDNVPGREITSTLGLCRGSAIRARHLGKDIMAGLKNMVGGEMHEYSKLLAETREQALDRMIEDARGQGADAVVAVRYASTSISQGAAEFLAYGTAVKLA